MDTLMLKHKNIILTIISSIALVLVMGMVLKHRIQIHHPADPIANAIINFQGPIPVRQIHVLTGDEFDLILQDGRRIHAVLDVRTSPLAKSKVLQLINRSRNPRIIIRKNLGNLWVVEMYLTAKSPTGGEVEVSLAKWLQHKNLAYQ